MKNEFYHILNRGVEKRKIFLTKEDYLRFVYDIQDFNTLDNVFSYRDRRPSPEIVDRGKLRKSKIHKRKQELVNVLCYCLMPNHPHLFIQEKIDRGASKFSQKLFIGYTKYFNLKNKRDGVLFQSRSKIILIKHNAHFLYIPFYILANPLDMFQPDWRKRGVTNPNKAFEMLLKYPWSSLYELSTLRKNDEMTDIITNKDLFFEIFDTGPGQFKKDFIEWLANYKGKLDFEDNFEDFPPIYDFGGKGKI